MQSNKSSKKTVKKTAEKAPIAAAPAAVAPARSAAAEVKPKPLAKKSSTPKKKSEEKMAASPSHHHKIVSAPAEPQLVETVTVTETITHSVSRVVTHEEIAELAHSYWVERGYTHGSPHEDWHRAEQELKQRK
jgi:hypothetical protein